MSSIRNAARSARLGLPLLLFAVGFNTAAQAEQMPPHVLGFSPAMMVALEREREMDLQAFDAPSGRRDRNGFLMPRAPQMWTLYGGLGFLSFQNKLEHDSSVQFKLGRSGPRLTGRLYLGIHRRY